MSSRRFVSMPPAIYDKQPNESAEAFAAFVAYRDKGIGRSVDAAFYAKQHGGKKGAKRAPSCWWRWSSENDWKRRASAYDTDEDRRRREEAAETRRQEVEAYRQGVRAYARQIGEAAALMLAKAATATQRIDPSDIQPGNLPNYLRAATESAERALKLDALAIGINPETGEETEAL